MHRIIVTRPLTIMLGASLLLIGCAAPTYDQSTKDTSLAPSVSEGKGIVTINGNVIEVTEDNVIRVRVPRKGELIEEGITVDAKNIVDVSLGLVELPISDSPVGELTNVMLTKLLQENKVELTLLDTDQALITLQDSDESIQEMLVTAGLALVKEGEINALTSKLREIQSAAEVNQIGVWSLENFTSLAQLFDGKLLNSAQFTEEQVNLIVKHVNESGWTLEEGLKDELSHLRQYLVPDKD